MMLKTDKKQIPKIVHYCWYGGKKKPKLVKDCIESWKKYLPDYKIIEWNEKNTDLHHPFVKDAYKKKKWAFVADYIRLEKIEEFGGVYLDTDMMLLKKIDIFLENECFFGAEDKEFISCGIIGAVPNHNFIKACREEYNFLEFENISSLGTITIPRIISQKFRTIYNFVSDFNIEVDKKEIIIYPSPYFYPLSYENRKQSNNHDKYIDENSYAVHLWNSSWVEYSEFQYLRNKEYFKGFCKMVTNIYENKEFRFSYFKKIASSIKESLINNK